MKKRKTEIFSCIYCGKKFEHRDYERPKYCCRACYVEALRAGNVKRQRDGFSLDLTGQRFGMLTAIKPTEHRIQGKVAWLCKCDCGVLCEKQSSKLKNGHVKSCGNHQSEMTTKRNLKHGMTIKRNLKNGVTHLRLYRIWSGMKTRCNNPKTKCAKYYKGRGITVCDEWARSFETFREWANANGYTDELTIDRIDNDKGYSPENCRWATWHEQRINQRRMKNEVQTM